MSTVVATPDLQTKLLNELHGRAAHHNRWRGADQIFIQLLIWIAVLSSFFAALAAAGVLSIPAAWHAALAAFPGLGLLIDKSFLFGPRASWHAQYTDGLQKLARELQYEGATVAATSAEMSRLQVTMRDKFPSWTLASIAKP